MRLVLLGAPGSGKGTQAHRLEDMLGVPHISTGDMLRTAVTSVTPTGLKAKAAMDAGHLVCDDILLDMLTERLAQVDVCHGFILDGYPRNLVQAHALDRLLACMGQPLDGVIKLDVPNETIIARCQRRYAVEHRKDDDPTVVRGRLHIYAKQTAPVDDFYLGRGLLHVIDGVAELDEVSRRISRVLNAWSVTTQSLPQS